MKRFLIITSIIASFLCSCHKIHLYPEFQSEEETVFLVKDSTILDKMDSLDNIACSIKFTADSLWQVSDSLRHTADSLYHISDSLWHAIDSLGELLYLYDGLEMVNVLPGESCTVFIPFMYARRTKSYFNIYDCHTFKGRARDGETVLVEQSFEGEEFFCLDDGLDSLRMPHYPLFRWWDKSGYYLGITVPENTSLSSRTISFDYSCQEQTLFNKWSEWIYISSIEQKGRLD